MQTKNEAKVQVWKAIQVILQTPHINSYLLKKDPKALEQLQKAAGIFEWATDVVMPASLKQTEAAYAASLQPESKPTAKTWMNTPAGPLKINGVNAAGTSLQGYICTTRAIIEKRLGPPVVDSEASYEQGGDKVSTEWVFQVGTQKITLFDWKERRKPEMDEWYEWHVGGNTTDVVRVVETLFVHKHK